MVEKGELTVPYVSTHENLADFLTKPLDIEKLAEALDQHVRVKPPAPARARRRPGTART